MHSPKDFCRTVITSAVIAALFAVAPRTFSAATIHVTTNLQGIADDGHCSLQEAIYSANFDFGVAPSSFNPLVMFDTGCEPGSGDDVIELQAGKLYQMTFILDDPYNPLGPTATPIVLSNITIEGHGAQLVRANPLRNFAAPNFRAFAVARKGFADPGVDLTIPGDGIGNLTIRNTYIKGFTAKGGNGAGGGGGGGGMGGAIYVTNATLTVDSSTFEDNGAAGGDGSLGANAGGGGGGGGLAGNGGLGGSSTTGGFLGDGNGGGGGGSRGNGGTARLNTVSGGGGGTLTAGEGSGVGRQGGYRCGGNGGGFGDDGADAACPGGAGGGGGGPDKFAPFVVLGGEGGDGNYGAGGGGGGYRVVDAAFTGFDHLTKRGGNGGFGGGGGATGGSAVVFDGRDIHLSSGGNGGFGGGGGAGDSAGSGGTFAGDGSKANGGGGAGLGGAIFSDFGNVTILNSTFKGNYVVRGLEGGAGAGRGQDAGGAIFSVAGALVIQNSTIAGNESTGEGAGVTVYRPTSNAVTTFTLQNTIIANNIPSTRECFLRRSVTRSGIGNLILGNATDADPIFACPGVGQTADPQLGPLQLTPPGNTPTMAIGANSPAASNADAATSLATDQRNVSRPRGDGPDIGAYEFGNQAPIARCRNVTVPAANACMAEASVDDGSSDPDADAITLQQSPAGPYSLGTTTVTLTVTDTEAASSSCTGTVTVTDTEPPTISPTLQLGALSMKAHNLVNVGFDATATDGCSAAPTSFIVQVFGDEDDQTPTGDNTVFSPDAANIDIGSLRLRSERVDSLDGRVYLIVVRGSDGSGNTGFACSTVVMPRNSSAESLASVNSQAATAKAHCEANGGAAPTGYFVIGDGPVIGPKQ